MAFRRLDARLPLASSQKVVFLCIDGAGRAGDKPVK
jgi:hypothetical protein